MNHSLPKDQSSVNNQSFFEERYRKFYGNKTADELENSVFIPNFLIEEYTFSFVPVIHLLDSYFREALPPDHLKRLVKMGLLEKFRFEEKEVVEYLKSKTPSKILTLKYVETKVCEWCCSETYVIHNHHYPTRRKHKGTELVKICPSCHYEFHFLSDKTFYRPVKKIVDAWEEALKEKARIVALKRLEESKCL